MVGSESKRSASNMSSFILIPGAGGSAWYWHRVVPLLERSGHEAIAVDLPGDDERKGLDDYAAIVVRAIGDRAGVILVAQSLGGFTAPLVCARVPVRMLVLPRQDHGPRAVLDHLSFVLGWSSARTTASFRELSSAASPASG